MNSEKKIKTLIGIVIFLLLSNIVMILFFVSLNNDNKSQTGNRNKNLIGTFLKNDAGFSPQQMEIYDTMRNQHIRNVKSFFDRLKSAKDSFYNLLYTNNLPDSIVNARAINIGKRQSEIDKNFFNFLTEVRKLCKPEQLPKFDSSFRNVVSKIIEKSGKAGNHKNEK